MSPSTKSLLMTDFMLRVATGIAGTMVLYHVEGAAGLAFAAPLWGVLLAKPIVNGSWEAARLIRNAAQDRAGWELYGVGMHELRVRSANGHPWIVATDLLSALELDTKSVENLNPLEYKRIPESREWGISEAGALKLIGMADSEAARYLALQLEREMFAPLRKRREGTRSSGV